MLKSTWKAAWSLHTVPAVRPQHCLPRGLTAMPTVQREQAEGSVRTCQKGNIMFLRRTQGLTTSSALTLDQSLQHLNTEDGICMGIPTLILGKLKAEPTPFYFAAPEHRSQQESGIQWTTWSNPPVKDEGHHTKVCQAVCMRFRLLLCNKHSGKLAL